jgi:hypothetical protein
MRTILPIIALSALTLGSGCKQHDTEMWFGQVADLKYDKSPCSHSYQDCQTCTRRRSDGSTYSESCNCVTKHRHIYDYLWAVAYDWDLNGSADKLSWDGDATNDGMFAGMEGSYRTFKDCGDCRLNAQEKQLWNSFDVGDRVAVPHQFENFLLVDPDSLHLNATSYVPASGLPNYPGYHNYHRFNSAINTGTGMDTNTWNAYLAEQNAQLGHEHQVHMMVVATYDSNPMYADALAEKWVLGKKNNAIFVFGLNSDDTINWSRLVSFSDVEMMRIRARDDFAGQHINGKDTAEEVVSITAEHFERGRMADKAYLMRNTWWYRWRWFILIPLGAVLGFLGFTALAAKTRRRY